MTDAIQFFPAQGQLDVANLLPVPKTISDAAPAVGSVDLPESALLSSYNLLWPTTTAYAVFNMVRVESSTGNLGIKLKVRLVIRGLQYMFAGSQSDQTLITTASPINVDPDQDVTNPDTTANELRCVVPLNYWLNPTNMPSRTSGAKVTANFYAFKVDTADTTIVSLFSIVCL